VEVGGVEGVEGVYFQHKSFLKDGRFKSLHNQNWLLIGCFVENHYEQQITFLKVYRLQICYQKHAAHNLKRKFTQQICHK